MFPSAFAYIIAGMAIVSLLIDSYISYRHIYPGRGSVGFITFLMAHVVLIMYLISIAVMTVNGAFSDSMSVPMWVLAGYLFIYIPKAIYAVISAFDYLHRPHGKLCARIGIIVAGLAAVVMAGACVNRLRICVNNVTIECRRLPQAFDGYRIVQFSDAHLETISSQRFARRIVETINKQQPHIVCFTGDLVNRKASELLPYQDILSRIEAPDGVFSVLGNHDYGDYVAWDNPAHREANLDSLRTYETRLNWTLLNNDHRYIARGNDSIAIIGVENWGEPPFPQYGRLTEAYPALQDSTFKILLSHNPRHWQAEVLPQTNIDLTLAGHTHAMQLCILGLSPASHRYPQWSGLYSNGEQHIYVNIGIGCIMLPARLGATPEITVITLRSKQ